MNQPGLFQDASAYNHCTIGFPTPGWNSLDTDVGYSHPEQPEYHSYSYSEQPGYNGYSRSEQQEYGISGSFTNLCNSSFVPLMSTSNSAVVQSQSYYSQSVTQQSLGTGESPPTPHSTAEEMQPQPPDTLFLPDPDPMIMDNAPQHEVLRDLNSFGQGHQNLFPTEVYPPQPIDDPANYVLGSKRGKDDDYSSRLSFDAVQKCIPRSIAGPWSGLSRRVGDPSPGAGVMVLAPQPDPLSKAYPPQRAVFETDQPTEPSTASGLYLDDIGVIDDDPTEWRHQLPAAAFGLQLTHSHPHSIPDPASGMSRSHSMSKTASQGSNRSIRKTRGGRNHGYRLSEEAAQNAKYMRQHGSCWHCFIMKKKCSPGEPCEACQGITNRHGFRTCTLPCFRKLKELAVLFFPDALVGHLHPPVVQKFCDDNILVTTRADLEIRLTTGYGKPFLLDAMSFYPVDNSQLTHGVGVVMDDQGKSARVWHETPFLSLHTMTGDFIDKVQTWLDEILFLDLEGWPEYCCMRDCFSWQRGILQAICNFFTSHLRNLNNEGIPRDEWSGRPRMLRKTLEFSILTFVMGHQLLIPEDEKLRLAAELDIHILQGTNVSCRLLNKLFKMMLLPKLQELTDAIMTELHVSLRDSKDPSDWGFDFSVMILLLTVVGENQISLDDVVACAIERGDFSRSREVDATGEMKDLESNLPNVFMKLFDTKYKSRGDTFNPFKSQPENVTSLDGATKKLIQDVWAAVDAHPSHCFFPWPEIGAVNPDQLYSFNVARLLSRFLRPFFEPSEDHHRSLVVGKRYKQ